MKEKFFLLLISISFVSCNLVYHSTPQYIKDGLDYCYLKGNNGIKSLINIEGYYEYEISFKNSEDKVQRNLMFFEDGIYCEGFFNTSIYNNSPEFKRNLDSYFKEIAKYDSLGERSAFYELFSWGLFTINLDTIKVQTIERPVKGSSDRFWYAHEIWYKVIDENSIIEIYRKPIHKINESQKNNFDYYQNNMIYGSSKFHPIEKKPKLSAWIKYEKWFWCSEQDYLKWMKE
jgi:hypothetical protein